MIAPRRPLNDPKQPLRDVLNRHGFEIAAMYIEYVPDVQAAIRSWDDYPACMDRYPAYLRR